MRQISSALQYICVFPWSSAVICYSSCENWWDIWEGKSCHTDRTWNWTLALHEIIILLTSHLLTMLLTRTLSGYSPDNEHSMAPQISMLVGWVPRITSSDIHTITTYIYIYISIFNYCLTSMDIWKINNCVGSTIYFFVFKFIYIPVSFWRVFGSIHLIIWKTLT